MRTRGLLITTAVTAASLAACRAAPPETELVFVDGRAVAPAADSLLAVTRSELRGMIIRDRRSARIDTIGTGALVSPYHLQSHAGLWYVSDVAEGRPLIVVLDAAGAVRRRVELDTVATTPHQFAVLPDQRIIVESAGALIALADGSIATFAIVPQGTRNGLLVAARGGVLHAVHGHAITLYNANGNIRWRLNWPWVEAAFVSDLAEDAQGRIHVLAGEQGRNQFVVFSLSPANGEVVRWSEPGPHATFAITRLGDIEPANAEEWFGAGAR